jgi:heterodisulfide reductase subunit B
VAVAGLRLVNSVDWLWLPVTSYWQKKTGKDLVAACSYGYRNLYNAHHEYLTNPRIKAKLDEALSVANLKYHGGSTGTRISRCLCPTMSDWIDCFKVKKDLTGLKVACWYGCHQTRPFGPDDWELPQWMDRL